VVSHFFKNVRNVRKYKELGGKMKKVWKENKILIISWLSIIIIVSILLLCLNSQELINNIIQAIAIITLVFVTWFYATQTQNLVK